MIFNCNCCSASSKTKHEIWIWKQTNEVVILHSDYLNFRLYKASAILLDIFAMDSSTTPKGRNFRRKSVLHFLKIISFEIKSDYVFSNLWWNPQVTCFIRLKLARLKSVWSCLYKALLKIIGLISIIIIIIKYFSAFIVYFHHKNKLFISQIHEILSRLIIINTNLKV